MLIEEKKEFFVCVVQRNNQKIDKYYRTDENEAKALVEMNKGLFPKADVYLSRETISYKKYTKK